MRTGWHFSIYVLQLSSEHSSTWAYRMTTPSETPMTGFRPQLTTSVPLAAFIEPIRKAVQTASARYTTAPVDRESGTARDSLIRALTGLATCTSWAEYDARRSGLPAGQFEVWRDLNGASEVEQAALGRLQDVCGSRHLKRCFDLGFDEQGKARRFTIFLRADLTSLPFTSGLSIFRRLGARMAGKRSSRAKASL